MEAERTVTLVNFDLHLLEGTNYAALLIGTATFPAPQSQPPTVETTRMLLTIDHLRTLHEVIGAALQMRPEPSRPPAGSTH